MLPPSVRIFVCTEPQDMRRSFDRLELVTKELLGEDPQSGARYVVRLEESDEGKGALVGSQRLSPPSKASSPGVVSLALGRRQRRSCPANRRNGARYVTGRGRARGTTSPSGLTWKSRISISGFVLSAAPLDEQFTELQTKLAALTAANEKLAGEREEYRKLYLDTLELCRKLEVGS